MLKRFLHIIFVFLVLFGSTGYTLHAHYCGEELQEKSISKTVSCCTSDEGEPDDCCRNEAELQQIQDDYLISVALELAPLSITFFDIPDFLIALEGEDIYFPEYQNYKPPLLDIDISVDIQTFLC